MGETRESDLCFVHAADLHLGSRRWLRHQPLNAALRQRIQLADRVALARLVDLCIEQRAALLVCAGDVIDGWCRNYMAALWLGEQLSRLNECGCRAVLLLGNHDVRCRMLKPLLLPRCAHLIGLFGPETLLCDSIGVALHGWSAPSVEPGADVALGYPPPRPDWFNIGVLHTSAEGARGHPDYAPCSRRSLRQSGYDYWALGHVHERQVISSDPWIVFSGNLQGRGAREPGGKGATTVRVQNGRVSSVEHHELAAVRFETLGVETQGIHHFDDLLDAIARRLASAERASSPVVARVVANGVEGAACALRVPTWHRVRALRELARTHHGELSWLDEVWADAGTDLGAWPLDHAA